MNRRRRWRALVRVASGLLGTLTLWVPGALAEPDGGSAPDAASDASARDAGPDASPDAAAKPAADDDWGDLEVKEADPAVVLPKLLDGIDKLSGQPFLSSAECRQYLASVPQHVRALLDAKIRTNRIVNSEQLAVLLSLKLSPEKMEIVLKDNCILCHVDPESQMPKSQFLLAPVQRGRPAILDLRELVSDVHFRSGLSCSGCHGGTPDLLEHAPEMANRWPAPSATRHADRSWIPEFCGRCHSDPTFMRNYNPGLPTDQLAKYRESMHGQKLLREHDSKAAQCVSCHGVHGIRDAESSLSRVHPKRLPETCGACHADAEYMRGYLLPDGRPLPTDQLERFKKSVHGRALLDRGDLGAPSCNDCHGNHAARPPEVASVSQVCRTCHVPQATLFDGSKHKKAFAANSWPECERCHGKHDIDNASDKLLGSKTTGLCAECHAKYAKDNPDCNEVAAHFRETIATLATAVGGAGETIERVARRGQDTDDLVAAKGDLEDALIRSRTAIHAFERSTFDQDGDRGQKALVRAETLLSAADEELAFRQRGVAIFIGIMVLLALGIYLRLRGIEARQRATERGEG